MARVDQLADNGSTDETSGTREEYTHDDLHLS
jgi:hypothetical protein